MVKPSAKSSAHSVKIGAPKATRKSKHQKPIKPTATRAHKRSSDKKSHTHAHSNGKPHSPPTQADATKMAEQLLQVVARLSTTTTTQVEVTVTNGQPPANGAPANGNGAFDIAEK